MIDVYLYSNPSLYLRDIWEYKKGINPKFSIRAWAMSLGLTSHSTLFNIVSLKKNIPKSYVPLLINKLALNHNQGDYFEALVNMQNSKNDEAKEHYASRLNDILAKNKIDIYNTQNPPPRDHQQSVIIELTIRKSSKEWIKRKISLDCSEEEILTAIDQVKNASLINMPQTTDKSHKSLFEHH